MDLSKADSNFSLDYDANIKMIIRTKKQIKESEMLNCLIWKSLKDLTDSDVEKYRKEVLGKDE